MGGLLESPVIHEHRERAMETNPVRQRIADLKGRLDVLRGYL